MRPYVTLLVGVISVSFASIFIRLADAPPLVIATYRLAIASLILIPVACVKARWNFSQLSASGLLWILLSAIFVALHFGLWITSLSYTSIASSVILVTSHPVFVAIISYFFLQERINRATITGIVIALVGVVCINYGGYVFNPSAFRGDLLALLAAFAMGGYLIIGSQLRKRIDVLPYLTLVYSLSAIILLIVTLLSGYRLTGYSSETYLMLVLLAVVPQLIGHSSLNIAVRLLPVTLVSVAILGEPVGATLLGYLILNEVPTGSEVIGGLLILGGIFIVLQRNPKRWVTK
jgi:drug/metabolite transporter (DMT)-like permease